MKTHYKKFLALLMIFAMILQYSVSVSFLTVYAEGDENQTEAEQVEANAEAKAEAKAAAEPTPAPEPKSEPKPELESEPKLEPEARAAKAEAAPVAEKKQDQLDQDSNPDGKDDTDGNEGNGTVEEQGSDSAVNIPEEISGESLAGGAASSSDGTVEEDETVEEVDETAEEDETVEGSVDEGDSVETTPEEAESYTITWANDDGSVLETDVVKEGDIPTYDSETPTKGSALDVAYVFSGWSPEVKKATEDTTYTATYSERVQTRALKALAAPKAAPKAAGEYTSINYEDGVEGVSSNGKTKAVRAWRDPDGCYYVAIASVDGNNEADDEFRARLDALVGTEYAAVDYIFNNKPLVVRDEDGNLLYNLKPSEAAKKQSDIWIIVKLTPEKFAEYTDVEGNNFVTKFPVINAGGFSLKSISIPTAIDLYTVRWVDWNWEEGDDPLETDTYNYGEDPEYNGEEPTREGFAFTGWLPEITKVVRDIIYRAVYAAVHTVTYTFTGDVPDGVSPPASAQYKTGDTVPAAAAPAEVEGYTFEGWVGEVSTMPDEDVDVTGNWIKNSHQVTYTYTGDVPEGAEPPAPATYKYGDTVPAAATPAAVEGYTFEGWEGEVTTMPDSDVEVTGNWVKNPEPTPEPEPEPTPAPAPNPGDGGNPGGGAAAAAAAPVAALAPAPAVVADNPVPQAEPEEIIDEPAPLAAPEGTWALMNLIAAALSTVGAGVALFRKKEDDDEEDETDPDDEDDNRGRNMAIAKGLGVAAAAASIAAFILTEDMSLPMAMTDKWTLLMAALFAGQVGTAVANKKASELEEEDDEEGAEA